MKKVLFITLLLTMFMASCGVGSYTVTTGLADEASISFVANDNQEIVVTIDGQQYNVETVELKDYRKDRSLKRTVKNTIVITPGTHEVKVTHDGEEVYTHKVFVSTGESKVIEL
jgi:acyl-coenzyme A synthetase/AMP-(fatty) acid ligase